MNMRQRQRKLSPNLKWIEPLIALLPYHTTPLFCHRLKINIENAIALEKGLKNCLRQMVVFKLKLKWEEIFFLDSDVS